MRVNYVHRASIGTTNGNDLNFEFFIVCRAIAAPIVGGQTAAQGPVIPVSTLPSNQVNLSQIGTEYVYVWDLLEQGPTAGTTFAPTLLDAARTGIL